MKGELGTAKLEIGRLRALLDRAADSCSGAEAGEARRRETIARPALVARLAGDQEQLEDRVRRNVAWHAQRCPVASAPPGDWRRAQRGPRLGARRRLGGEGLRADAEVFVPAAGTWEPPSFCHAESEEEQEGTSVQYEHDAEQHDSGTSEQYEYDAEQHDGVEQCTSGKYEYDAGQHDAVDLAPGVWEACGQGAECAAQAFGRGLAAG